MTDSNTLIAPDAGTLLTECRGSIKVLALTGIRSEYDLFFPLLKQLDADPSFKLGVIVCGAHLTDLHKQSVEQIELDGFWIAERLETLLHSNSRMGKVKSSGGLLTALAQTLEREKPDLLLVLGDREEPLMGSLSGLYLGIPVVHLAGGDSILGGCPDEWTRHATTKMSHIHLTMCSEHSQRLLGMGEEPWRVHTVGSGGVDRLRLQPSLSKEDLYEKVGEGVLADYGVLIVHALMDNHCEEGGEQVKICLEASLKSGLNLFVGAPNSDPGYQSVNQVIQEFSQRPEVTLYHNLPRSLFINLLRQAKCLIGNSSLAFHEAAFLGLPAVNVGDRQQGRLSAGNVSSVPFDADLVFKAVQKAAFDPDYRSGIRKGNTLYGDGYMAGRSVDILKQLPGKLRLLKKRMTY